jgi:hypothetical protein
MAFSFNQPPANCFLHQPRPSKGINRIFLNYGDSTLPVNFRPLLAVARMEVDAIGCTGNA